MKVRKPLELEEGKTYTTKMASGETFTITSLKRNPDGRIISMNGIYNACPHLGECPISPERLIPEYHEVEEPNFVIDMLEARLQITIYDVKEVKESIKASDNPYTDEEQKQYMKSKLSQLLNEKSELEEAIKILKDVHKKIQV